MGRTTWNGPRCRGIHQKEREIKVKGKEAEIWALVGVEVAVTYLPPDHQVDAKLRTMSGADVIIGDLNCCGEARLEHFIKEHQLEDIRREDHTHKCRIYRVLTEPGGRPRFFTEEWGCNSDYTTVAARYRWDRRK